MMGTLEGSDEYIMLDRAAELSGRSIHSIQERAFSRQLRTVKVGQKRVTTRRWLHEYLEQARANTNAPFHPLPEGYLPPE
jgi:hypothetical protein